MIGVDDILRVEAVSKSFVLHVQGAAEIPVLGDVTFSLGPGEALALTGPSGSGKSTLMRMIYGNYRTLRGKVLIRRDRAWVDVSAGHPRAVTELRRDTMGYISQFLRVIPRVATFDIVAEPARARGVSAVEARERARTLLRRLAIPEALWHLSPVTFSGGEQQRVNIARGFAAPYPLLLLDEPTASLDAANRQIVVEMIGEARAAGAAIVGIFHDRSVREAVCTRELDLEAFKTAAA